MAHVISEACTKCDACRPACPAEAIFKVKTKDDIYIIDPNVCNDCADVAGGPKCVPECPVDAIHPVQT